MRFDEDVRYRKPSLLIVTSAFAAMLAANLATQEER